MAVTRQEQDLPCRSSKIDRTNAEAALATHVLTGLQDYQLVTCQNSFKLKLVWDGTRRRL